MKREYLLGLPVDMGSMDEILDWVEKKVKGKKGLGHIITAYSEFFVRAGEDVKFREVWKEADLVTADGMGVVAALEYKKKGLLTAVMGLLGGRLGKPVTGVELFKRLVEQDYKVFLLGGFGDTAERLVKKIKKVKNKQIKIDFDAGAQSGKEMIGAKNDLLVNRINKFDPEILFVAYGPGRQEKWIYENKGRLKARVVIGVGGAFDEVLGKFPPAPRWMEERGLKWLQRLIVDPKRWRRMIKAVVAFPLMVVKGK